MKKILLLATVLLGTAAASQAGIQLNIGIGFPFPHREYVVVQPAPVIIAPAPPFCAPVVVAAPVYPPVIYYPPAPQVVYAPPVRYYHGPPNRDWDHHDDHRHGPGRW